jgi:PhnB protein
VELYTQLNFGGNCEEAFRFYEKLLGGRITMMMKVKDLPPGTPQPPGSSPEAVIHVHMDLPNGMLLGNDVPPDIFQPIRSSYLYLMVDSTADAERIFQALAEGGSISIPMREQFFAKRFGQCRDRFGVLWSILHQEAN